jgi:CysZ protein
MLATMEQLATGVRDFGRGVSVLNAHPRLWKWIIAPAVVTGLLIAGSIVGILRVVDPVSSWIVRHLPSVIAHLASSVVTALIVVVLVAAALLVFVPVAGMIAGPFNEILSEHIESQLTGRPSAPFSLRAFVHGFARGVSHGVRRLLATLLGLVLVFALGFVPVIGTIAAMLLGAWLTAHGAAYDCYDAVLARRAMSYRDKIGYLARHRQRTLGLGATVATLLLVPGVNLVALGLGAAGATVAAVALDARVAVPVAAGRHRAR